VLDIIFVPFPVTLIGFVWYLQILCPVKWWHLTAFIYTVLFLSLYKMLNMHFNHKTIYTILPLHPWPDP